MEKAPEEKKITKGQGSAMKNTIEQRLAAIKKDNRAFRPAEVRGIDVEARTVELAFSSEAEARRWWGIEILSHDPGAVILDRLQAGAALLVNHDTSDQVGVIESVSIDADRRGRAVVRFGRSDRAEEIFDDVKDNIRKHVSVGYIIHDALLIEQRDGEDVWKITSWEPFEVSIVPVPVDITVGVGRNLEIKQNEIEPRGIEKMPDEKKETQPLIDAAAEHRKGTEAERARVRSIVEMGEKFGAPDLARDAVKDGVSVAEFQQRLLDHINARAQKPLADQLSDNDIGLTDKEARSFSFLRVIRALAEPTDQRLQREAAFEFEASRAAAEKSGRKSNRFTIPTDVLCRALNTSITGTDPGDTGGFLVATELLSASFIEILRNRATIMQLGTVIGGLVGNVDIPKQTVAAQGYWLGEDDDATESIFDLGHIVMSPKTVGAYSEITRRLLMQSSRDVEAMVRADLARALALTIDAAGYYGTGDNDQPKGIASYDGINAKDFVATQPTFAELVAMETLISLDNADVQSMAYVGDASFRGHCKTTEKFTGTGATLWEPGGTVNGYAVQITNQITTGDVFMGNFADLLIGMWGGLDLMVDPYTHSKKGRIRVVIFQDVDYALRREESFCLGKKQVTT